MAFILVVEDEVAIADLVAMQIKMAGHQVGVVHDGSRVMPFIEKKLPDLIVLDVMLPGEDGFSLMKQIAPLAIPVIFLTAKDALEDKIIGLRLGADDYIVKPFAALELITRVEAVLRRCNKNTNIFILGRVEARFDEHLVLLDGAAVDLTLKEFDLLRVLVENKNLALSRDQLLELVWGFDYLGETRTVDVHIQRLRKKLNMDDYIKTVYKLGYRLEVPR